MSAGVMDGRRWSNRRANVDDIWRKATSMPAWFWRLREDRCQEGIFGPPPAAYGECPYYRRTGICNLGCWEEPECMTCVPRGGWPRFQIDPHRIARRLGVPS